MTSRAGFERVRAALDGVGVALASHPDGSVRGRCPLHGGTTRTSLSLRWIAPAIGDRCGRTQLRCWAGCDERDVLDHVGLSLADLYDEPPPSLPGQVRREHVYLDGAGRLAAVVRRVEPKSFRPASPSNEGWRARAGEQLPVLPYRLPEVVAAVAEGRPVYVVEGERDADALTTTGQVATCNAGGAGKWREHHSHWLAGAHVVVCRDRDPAGHRHAEQVLASLRGVAATVRLVEPTEGKDVADHLAAGRLVDDLADVPLDEAAPPGEVPMRRLKVTLASEVVMRRIRWLWDLRIVLGGLTLLAGREGIGKSTVAAWLTAAVTRGLLDGEHQGKPRAVVYVNSEDARDYTIVPRLLAADADLDRVVFVDAVMPGDDGREYESALVLPGDAALLADIVRRHDAVLVVLDAATSTIDSRLDGDRDRQMRQGLEAIGRDIGERTGCAVLGIVHFGKRDSSDTGKLILGSIAWSQVARSVLAVALDEENSSLVISRTKGNLGVEPASLAARIVSASVKTAEGDTFVGHLEWLGETERDARTLLAAVELDPEDRTERDSAADWLRDFLTPTPGDAREKVPSKDVKKAAREAGFSERTLARARASLGVRVASEGFPRESFWSLPDADPGPSDASDATASVGERGGGTTGLGGTTGPDLHLCDASGSPSGQSCQSCHADVHGTTGGTTAAAAHEPPHKCSLCGLTSRDPLDAQGRCPACT